MSNTKSVLLLSPSRNSKHNNNNSIKYKLDCQTIIDKSENVDTKEWLNLEKQIEHDSEDYILYNALLEKNKQIVVKIGPEKLKYEYEIGKLLDTLKIPTFLEYICIFNCLDDFYKSFDFLIEDMQKNGFDKNKSIEFNKQIKKI